MDKNYYELKDLFLKANKSFIARDRELLDLKVSERTLCGALMIHLNSQLQNSHYKDYFVDVEYNKNKGGRLKTIKTIYGPEERVVRIICDLIVHSRGHCLEQDNLIAVEMKKHSRSEQEKLADKERLSCLTQDSFNNIWSFDGKSLPEHVCRYKIGIYYEVNYRKKEIKLEYYWKGCRVEDNTERWE